jgi:hypothetical protein
MSSIAGHAAAGITAYLCCNRGRTASSRWALAPFAFLAVCPDLDYLAVWLIHYDATPRFTHSLAFGMGTALLVHWAARTSTNARLPLGWLMAASASHPVLDLLVGAHPVPLLWPFGAELAVAVGVLPSAGAPSLGNYFLWRNLLIELGVLFPVFALMVAVSRRVSMGRLVAWAACVAPVWGLFLGWSLSLVR